MIIDGSKLAPWEKPSINDFRGLNRSRPSPSDRGLEAPPPVQARDVDNRPSPGPSGKSPSSIPASKPLSPATMFRDSQVFLAPNHVKGLRDELGVSDQLRSVPAGDQELASILNSFKSHPPVVRGIHRLQVDVAFSGGDDALRWKLLLDVALSGEKILILMNGLDGVNQERHTLTNHGVVSTFEKRAFVNRGETFVSKSIQRSVFGRLIRLGTLMSFTSWSEDVSIISLTEHQASTSTLVHEMLGHLWLALKKHPFGHLDKTRMSIPLPDGSTFTGTPEEFVLNVAARNPRRNAPKP